MAFLGEVRLDARTLLREVDEFHEFLRNKPRGERKHFLPFFTKHPQICTYLGFFNIGVRSPTHIATEFSLWGDFTCDLVAGSIRDKAFVCVEFEDAAENSLFRPQAGRKNSHWGTRAEHGVSQVIDWLFRISREGGSDQLQARLWRAPFKTDWVGGSSVETPMSTSTIGFDSNGALTTALSAEQTYGL